MSHVKKMLLIEPTYMETLQNRLVDYERRFGNGDDAVADTKRRQPPSTIAAGGGGTADILGSSSQLDVDGPSVQQQPPPQSATVNVESATPHAPPVARGAATEEVEEESNANPTAAGESELCVTPGDAFVQWISYRRAVTKRLRMFR